MTDFVVPVNVHVRNIQLPLADLPGGQGELYHRAEQKDQRDHQHRGREDGEQCRDQLHHLKPVARSGQGGKGIVVVQDGLFQKFPGILQQIVPAGHGLTVIDLGRVGAAPQAERRGDLIQPAGEIRKAGLDRSGEQDVLLAGLARFGVDALQLRPCRVLIVGEDRRQSGGIAVVPAVFFQRSQTAFTLVEELADALDDLRARLGRLQDPGGLIAPENDLGDQGESKDDKEQQDAPGEREAAPAYPFHRLPPPLVRSFPFNSSTSGQGCE